MQDMVNDETKKLGTLAVFLRIASGARLAPDAAKCSHFREAIFPLVSRMFGEDQFLPLADHRAHPLQFALSRNFPRPSTPRLRGAGRVVFSGVGGNERILCMEKLQPMLISLATSSASRQEWS
jgi:hypothetical protein